MTGRLRSRDDLVERLRADGVAIDAESAPDRVLFTVDEDGLQTTAVVVWPEDVALISVVLPLPIDLTPDVVPVFCEAVLRLNHLLLLPGFGIDLRGAFAYFRVVQARDADGSITVEAVQRLVQAAVGTASGFAPLLVQVARGMLTPVELESALG